MAETFADRWHAKERLLGITPPSPILRCGEVELPEYAAPCLDFKHAAKPLVIPDVFGPADQWLAADRDRLAPFRMIGTDGAGNPICLEHGSGHVVLLDHENAFPSMEFVNTSVAQLEQCLLAYFGETDAERFRQMVSRIDPPALAEGAFWSQEALNLSSQ